MPAIARSVGLALALFALPLACSNGSGGDGLSSQVIDSGKPSQQSDATLDADAGPGDTGPGEDTSSSVGGGIVPTTCPEANGAAGCCGPGGINYYCSTTDGGMIVKSETCMSGTVCGWDASKSYYGCVTPPATSSSAAPAACGASGVTDSGTTDSAKPGEGGSEDSSAPTDASMDTSVADSSVPPTDGGAIPTTCAEADDVVGCCGPNGKNYYCAADAGTVSDTTCATGKVCSWNASKKYYGCVTGTASTADPSGTYPIACQ